MDQQDKDIIQQLSTKYGVYEVAKALSENAQNECSTSYKNNEVAVIHRDAASMVRAVDDMRNNHPLRFLVERSTA
jgi:TRAP-type C4-dicarboxylate transport system substrate-binding protein